ncbi:C3a anaphylatoxin chemotactic receptor-like [Dendropsophus ebraccatus]|uniref:C3a anaphylatoxin chemotactic receptor-like n=1 Tax=Dendropsophus ebraccatus TaxID=150705 RepID=UPI00383205BB
MVMCQLYNRTRRYNHRLFPLVDYSGWRKRKREMLRGEKKKVEMDRAGLNLNVYDEIFHHNQSFDMDYETNNITVYRSFDEKESFEDLTIILYSIICALGTIGNGLVIWIAGFRRKKTVSAVWFLDLAIADFLCCASLPLRIAEMVFYLSYDMFCLLSIILFNLNMSASVLLLTAMSIDRWVSVMWPFWSKVHRTHKLVRITAAIIWLLSLFISVLLFFLYGLIFYDVTEWCIFSPLINVGTHICKLKQTIQLIRLLVMFLIPFSIILISYLTIFLKLKKSKRPKRSQRPYRIITAVILCFFICWLPYYIWPLTPLYGENVTELYIVDISIINLACLNSCLNPVIYVLMGQKLKCGFCRSIPSRLEKALSEQPNDPWREQEDYEQPHTTAV